VNEPGEGLRRFAAAIPERLVSLLDPHALASTEDVRAMITVIVLVFATVVLLRFVLGLSGGFLNLLRGRSGVVRTSGALSLLRKLAVIGAIASPAYALVELVSGGGAQEELTAATVFSAVIWLVLRASDHNKAWIEVDGRKLHVEKGFALLRVTRLTIHLSRALLDATTRAPVGESATARPVYVRREAHQALVEALGDKAEADAMLRGAVARIGLVPAGRKFVARGSRGKRAS